MSLRALEAQLGAADPEERRRAAAALSEQEGEQRVSLLLRALGDADWRVRKEATTVAVGLAPALDVLGGLLDALRPGDNVGLRNAAVEAIGGFGAPAVDALSKALPKLDADGRKLAAEALAKSSQPSALKVLRTLLADADSNVRIAAVEGISAVASTCPEEAIGALEHCLAHQDRFVRLAALDGLNLIGAAIAWERIEGLLTDPVLSRSALLAAGRSAHRGAAPMLVRTLQNARGAGYGVALTALVDFIRSSEDTLASARTALQQLDDEARERLLGHAAGDAEGIELKRDSLILIGALGGARAASIALGALSDDGIAAEAEEALAMLGPSAVPLLVDHAGSGDVQLRARCVELLGRLADDATRGAAMNAIVGALGDSSVDVLAAALGALASVGDASCLRPVVAWLSARNPSKVRKAAEKALAALARRHPAEAKQLAAGCTPSGEQAFAAAVVIAALGSGVRAAVERDVEFLGQVLSSDDPVVRRAALDAFAAIRTPLAVEPVAFALTDEEAEVRFASVRALGKLRTEDGAAAGVGHLFDIVARSADSALIAAAIAAVGQAGDARGLPVLRQVIRREDPMQVVAAVEALSKLRDPRRVDALIDALNHPEPEVVKASLRMLVLEQDPRVQAHLAACLDSEAWDVRRLAADLIGRSGSEVFVAVLRTKLVGEVEPLVKEALTRSLAALEGGASLRRTSNPPSRRGSWPPA